jgi:hypothetical protein
MKSQTRTGGLAAMLGRKDYTKEELVHAKAVVDQQLTAYKKLIKAVEGAAKAKTALAGFETPCFNNMVLALDRPFVHRLRMVTGKDTSPLNELELLVESLMNNGGVLRGNNVIKYVPDQSVLKLEMGDQIELKAAEFERLARAVFVELETTFLK